jgi:hypothetical protein
MPNLDDKDIADLASALRRLLDEMRWPFSPQAMRWCELLEKLQPQPERPALPPLKHYEPPTKDRYRRNR